MNGAGCLLIVTLFTMASFAAAAGPDGEPSLFAEFSKVARGEFSPETFHDALARDAVRLLQVEADPAQSISGHPVFLKLRRALVDLGLRRDGETDVVSIHVGNRDGRSEDLVLIAFQHMPESPAVVIHRVGATYDVLPYDTVFLGPALSTSVRAVDVTGDGVEEVIAIFEQGGDSNTTDIDVFLWRAARQRLERIFSVGVNDWAGGPCGYRFVPTATGHDIEITAPFIGIFDARSFSHQAEVVRWTYDAAADRFIKRSDSVAPATSARQQLNEAEDLFRRGELDNAVRAYHRAWSDTSLTERGDMDWEDMRADFRGFARFREGELLAVLGREREARRALDDTAARGGELGVLARTFLMNYGGTNGAARAWAALPGLGYQSPPIVDPADRTALNVWGDPADVLYLGEVIVSYLGADPSAAETPEQVFQTVRAWGLDTVFAIGADLDGDRTNEFLFETVKDGADRVWLVYRHEGRWRADDSFRHRVNSVGAVIPLPKGNAVDLHLAHPPLGPHRAVTWRDGRWAWIVLPSLDRRDFPAPEQSFYPTRLR